MNALIKQLEKDYDVIMASNPNSIPLQSKKEFVLHWLNVELKLINRALTNWKEDEQGIYTDSFKIRLSRKKEIEKYILEIKNNN